LQRSAVIAVSEHWWLPTRIEGEEWLDAGRGTSEAIDRSLADLSRINRWLGDRRGLASYLYPRMRRCQTDRIGVLDLGAGGCAIPEAIARWARHAAISVQIYALDLRQAHLRWAQRRLQSWPEIAFIQGDVRSLPLAEGSVDFVISSLFLHHFTALELSQLLPQWACLARQSLIMTDLVRHPAPYWFMKVMSPLFARSPITRHDAAVSIRRAYRAQELQSIAAEAGLAQARVRTCFPYRMILVVDHPVIG
jgi:2-polyprenyl-3-methyl-5-hydroxy-6-metoxy-1,4-benzoquinol methylase